MKTRSWPNRPALRRRRNRLALSLILGLISSAIFWSFRNPEPSWAPEERARVVETGPDTRLLPASDPFWRMVDGGRGLRAGDRVFIGAGSFARVELREGGEWHLFGGSLASLERERRDPVFRVEAGRFRLNLTGTMKFTLRDRLFVIEGRGAEAEFTALPGWSPTIKSIRGEIRLRSKESLWTMGPASPELSLPLPAEGTSKTPRDLEHVLRVGDLYDANAQGGFRPASGLSFRAGEPVELDTGLPAHVPEIHIEISRTPDFRTARRSVFEASPPRAERPFAGVNYWRYSLDGESWSPAAKFEVRTRFHPDPQLSLDVPERAPIRGEPASIPVVLTSSDTAATFLVEVSSDPTFPPARTYVVSRKHRNADIPVPAAGTYFARARGVSPEGKLTALSMVRTLKIDLDSDGKPNPR